MGINPDTITFSGLSGGSYMATTMHVIHSETIKGTGLIVGGPYAFDWIGCYEEEIPRSTLGDSFEVV